MQRIEACRKRRCATYPGSFRRVRSHRTAVTLLLCVLTGSHLNAGAYCHTARSKSNGSAKEGDPGWPNGERADSLDELAPGSSSSASDRPTIFIGILARQVAAPAVMIPALFLIRRAVLSSTTDSANLPSPAMTGSVIRDPCFVLVMVLLIGAPPAITLAQMTAVNKFPVSSPAYAHQEYHSLRFQHFISKTLLTSYTVFTPIATVVLVSLAVVIVHAGN